MRRSGWMSKSTKHLSYQLCVTDQDTAACTVYDEQISPGATRGQTASPSLFLMTSPMGCSFKISNKKQSCCRMTADDQMMMMMLHFRRKKNPKLFLFCAHTNHCSRSSPSKTPHVHLWTTFVTAAVQNLSKR